MWQSRSSSFHAELEQSFPIGIFLPLEVTLSEIDAGSP
jgi:hypothetical protein